MDLGRILGIAVTLYMIIFSIVDSYQSRHYDDPTHEPVASPPVSTPETKRAEALTRNRIEMMKKVEVGHLLLKDYQFSGRITEKDMTSPESMRTRLNDMLQEMCRYLELPATYTVEVIPDEDFAIAPDRGAECAFASQRINFYYRSQYTAEQLTAMLCHECAHYFCLYNGMYEYKQHMLNEHYTDITACLMGFSKYMFIPHMVNYLNREQIATVRWTLLQERKAAARTDSITGQSRNTASSARL